MPILGVLQGKTTDVKLWTPIEEVESQALDQLKNIASLPWVRHVCAMPDVHLGKGATVGSVIAMKDAVSPNAVGVDIGCGMAAVKTNMKAKDLPDDLRTFRDLIEHNIPVGNGPNGSWDSPTMNPIFQQAPPWLDEDAKTTARKQLGTLGGGNHFIELCLDESDTVWIMLHSGSRNVGKRIAEAHVKVAKQLEHNRDLPDPDLAVFLNGTREMTEYRTDLMWAQNYAAANRRVMLARMMELLKIKNGLISFGVPINCHHNYVSEERHFGEDLFVTRKGAIRAEIGEYGIIPGSMGTASYIVAGKGAEESLASASHGAGRRMSRGQAKRTFTTQDLEEQTKGVECRKDSGVIDEIPGAYKDINKVMEYQEDLVVVVTKLKPVLSVKG